MQLDAVDRPFLDGENRHARARLCAQTPARTGAGLRNSQVSGQNSSTAQRRGTRISPSGRVTSFPASAAKTQNELRARPYPPRVPDGDYLASCTRTYWDRNSRIYGERIYIYFRILEDGEHAGKELRMICRPSVFPTSKYYIAWSIAHDGPPRSRNTKLSPKIFPGKLYRIRTATVRPRHRITGPDGKIRSGDFLPEHLWYSKVDCILTLELTDPVILTEKLSKSFPTTALSTGEVGRRELGVGNGVGRDESQGCSRGGNPSTNAPNQVGDEGNLVAGPTPAPSIPPEEEEKYAERVALLREQARQLQEQGK